MASRPPARRVVSQPYISSFYDTADLADGVKSVNLEYREQNLRDLSREDSLEGIVVSLDDLESDSGQTHKYAESEGHSSADTGNLADLADTSISDSNTDLEHSEAVIKKVFGGLVDDPLWPYLHDVQVTVQLESTDWDKLLELVQEHNNVYQLFS
ncbi:uncharacterized protein B0H18DRAFT_1124957 [Fomitopsis serialis]|uniref:uncharacterized protein n=1 Tax=Fomitopsis serialis TaxID=139415 RepID=UPI002008E47D|nr:uncharacterized protein B0H18DRAFT_1124957 [Neoantrodia serialis]KAH9915371.1 hypothetical protein B0H18DRAFT_1124957 [Neoantrodia serialis]